jgi:hypothetical protein
MARVHLAGKRANRGCAWAGTETIRGATDNAGYRHAFRSLSGRQSLLYFRGFRCTHCSRSDSITSHSGSLALPALRIRSEAMEGSYKAHLPICIIAATPAWSEANGAVRPVSSTFNVRTPRVKIKSMRSTGVAGPLAKSS